MFKYVILFVFGLLIINFNIVNAETVEIPNWVFRVYDFWIEEKISEQEFITALTYMETNKIINFHTVRTMESNCSYFY